MADDRTQFYIDILAKMTGADTSIGAVATLGDKMLAGKATVEDFERTIESMSGALEDSGAALKSANDALAAGEAKYSQLEVAADRAAKMVEKLAQSGKSGDAFTKRQAEAAQKAQETTAALAKEASVIDTLKSKAGAAASQHDALTKGLKNVKGAAEEAAKAEGGGTGNLRALASGLGKIGGPAGEAGQKVVGLASAVKKIGTSLGAIGPYVAAAVAIFAIGTAAILATAAIAKWGIAMADTNRTNSLLAQGVARSVAGGELLDSKITDLGAVVPQTREELLAMADDLAKTGLRGQALSNALETAAVKAAKLKFGPDFSEQMLSLDVQSRRLHDNIAQTFGGLKIEGLLGGLSKLVALFDSSTASGKALKFLFEALFQPVIDGATGAIPSVERLFLQAEVLALKAYIALKPYRSEIAEVGKALLIGAAAITGVVVVAFALLGAAIGGVIYVVGKFVAAIPAMGAALGDAAFAIVQFFAGLPEQMSEIATNIIQGLVNGITGGATAVVDALKGVVTGGVDAAKKALGIASPSKVFEDIGRFTSAGFAGGVDAGAGDGQESVEALVATPKGGGGGAKASGGGVTLTIENVNVNGQNAKEQALDFIDQVTRLLESDALSLGGGEVPA